MKKERAIPMILSVALALCLVGCGNTVEQEQTAENGPIDFSDLDISAPVIPSTQGNTNASGESTLGEQNALEKALTNYKAKDTDILSKMLDMDKIKFNEKFEIVEGLEEQINPLKESHDYLFDSDKPLPKFSDKTPGADNGTEISKEDFKKMSYKDRVALKQEQPEVYENLKD